MRATASRFGPARSPVADGEQDDTDPAALPEGATPETEEVRQRIEEAQPRLQIRNLTGAPILELPEPSREGEAHGDGE